MFTMETKSKKSPEEIIKQAVKFFGPEGYQLEIKEQTDSWAFSKGEVVESKLLPARKGKKRRWSFLQKNGTTRSKSLLAN